jgi:hypothetical protein
MNEDRSTTRQSFFSRVFAGSTEGEGTSIYSSEEIGAGMPGTDESEGLAAHGFTVERAAEVIRNLPPEVPRPAAVRIVRGTLEAAGIDIAELQSSTRARESKLNSEIDLSENRIQQFKEETEEVIRNLEDQIRKAREARDFGVSEEERKISSAESGLDNIDLVRDFFGLQQEYADEPPPRFSAVQGRSRTLRTTWKPGMKRNSEHPAPPGAPRPGFCLQPARRRALPGKAPY